MAFSNNELLHDIANGTPGYFVYYDENGATKTYVVDTDFTPCKHWEVNNVGAASLTVEINDSGIDFTVDAGKGFGALGHKEGISKIIVTATDDYRLLLRE